MLSSTIKDYKAKLNRRLSFQELTDFCKVHFDDYQFIDQIAQFAAEKTSTVQSNDKPELEVTANDPKLENGFTQYISLDKIKNLCNVVMNLTRLLEGKSVTHANLVEIFTDKAHPETMPLSNQQVMKHDPHL